MCVLIGTSGRATVRMAIMYSAQFLNSVIKAYDIRGLVESEITTDFVRNVGRAFADFLKNHGTETRVAVGHDMRPSSPELAAAFAEGVAESGLDVTALGLVSTDELYFAAGQLDCAGAMFTASHNPASYNGIKLCRAGAKPVGQDTGLGIITDYLAHLADDGGSASSAAAPASSHGTVDRHEILADYARYLNELVPLSAARPLVVAVDAANGMAGHTVPAVFADLPIEIRPLYFELDGTFPNHEANPLDPKNLVDLQRFTVEQGADVGLAFDGDADRVFLVDEKGQPVSPSAICALIAECMLQRYPGATIIHNLITSKMVPELVEKSGGTAVRTKVGHSFIKAEMAKHNAVFGGEHSAHYYFSEFFNADSGMLAALHMLAALAAHDGSLSELMASYQHYAASGEINFRVTEQAAARDKVRQAFADRAADIDELDGMTVNLQASTAWFNLRASNTEPLLRLNVEAETPEHVSELVDEISALVS